MKLDFNHESKYARIGITAFLVIASSMVLYYAMFHGRTLAKGWNKILTVMAPVIYGCAIAFLLTPIVNFLEKNVVGGVWMAMGREASPREKKTLRLVTELTALFVFLLIIYALLAMILPDLIQTVMTLISNIPSYAQTISLFLQKQIEEGYLSSDDSLEIFNNYYGQFQEYMTNNIVPELQTFLLNLTSGVFGMIVFLRDFLIGALISLYVIDSKEVFVAKAKMVTYAVFPLRWAKFFIRAMRYTSNTFSGFITGKLVDSAVIGFLCYLGCSILKMPYTLLVSVVIGATNVIPFFGPFLGAIPCLILILLVNPWKSLYFLLFILVLQQFDGNFLGPRILGNSTGLSSFMVIVAILVGGGFFGLFGMLLGVPAFAVCYNGFEWLTRRRLREKELTTNREDYIEIDYLDLETKKPIPKTESLKVKQSQHKSSATWKAFLRVLHGLGKVLIAFMAYVFSRHRKIINSFRDWKDKRKKEKR